MSNDLRLSKLKNSTTFYIRRPKKCGFKGSRKKTQLIKQSLKKDDGKIESSDIFVEKHETISFGFNPKNSSKIKKSTIYLFNCENFDSLITEKIYKLNDKIKEANFSVKLIKNFTQLNNLYKNNEIQKIITESYLFMSIVKNETFLIENFQSEILFAYESSKNIILILLEEIDTYKLNAKLRKVFESSEVYSFYKDQKALDNIIPIQFNSFLFHLNNHRNIQV